MAEPSVKSPEVETKLIQRFGFDRRDNIRKDLCSPPPIGCGRPAPPESFRDDLSAAEFTISGLCQACQDRIFGSSDD